MQIINKIYSICNKKIKIYFILIIIFNLFVSLIEILSISSIYPVLSFFFSNKTNNFLSSENRISFLDNILNLENFDGSDLIILLLLIYFIKTFIVTIFNWLLMSFVFLFEKDISNRLFNKYLNANFNFHIENNSSFLIRNLTSEIAHLSNALSAFLTLLTELIIVIVLVSYLFYANFNVTIIIVVFTLVCSYIYISSTKKYIKLWSQNRQDYEGHKIKLFQHSLGAIQEIKISNKLKIFSNFFSQINSNLLKMIKYQRFLIALPRIWLEMISISSILLVCLYLMKFDEGILNSLPLLGVFLAASIRLLPSTTKILNSLQGFKYSVPSINLIFDQLSKIKAEINIEDQTMIDGINNLEINDISFKYKNIEILKNIKLKINKNEIIGIKGESGTGKTTLINLITGFLKPNKGNIKVNNININICLNSYRKKIGLVPQNVFLFDDTIQNNISLTQDKGSLNPSNLKNSLKLANLENFIQSLKFGLETFVGERGSVISGGQKQRIGIARALYNNPDLLILDESTNSLDKNTTSEIMKDLKNNKNDKIIFIISHDDHTLSFCDKIFSMGKCNLVQLK